MFVTKEKLIYNHQFNILFLNALISQIDLKGNLKSILLKLMSNFRSDNELHRLY